MSNVIKLTPAGENSAPEQHVDGEALVEIFDDMVIDNHASLANKDVMSMPIAQLATLGAGVASMLPTFRTITESTPLSASAKCGRIIPSVLTDD